MPITQFSTQIADQHLAQRFRQAEFLPSKLPGIFFRPNRKEVFGRATTHDLCINRTFRAGFPSGLLYLDLMKTIIATLAVLLSALVITPGVVMGEDAATVNDQQYVVSVSGVV